MIFGGGAESISEWLGITTCLSSNNHHSCNPVDNRTLHSIGDKEPLIQCGSTRIFPGKVILRVIIYLLFPLSDIYSKHTGVLRGRV